MMYSMISKKKNRNLDSNSSSVITFFSHGSKCVLMSFDARGVGNVRFVGLVGLGPATVVEFSP